MANQFSEPFEGSDGVALSTSNTVFNVTPNGAGTAAFATGIKKRGTSSARWTTSSNTRMSGLTTSNSTARYWSHYFYPTAAPSVNTVMFWVGLSDFTTRTFQLVFNTGRTMKIQDQGSIIIGSNTTSAAPLNEWSRVDLSCVSGTVTLHFYPGNANADNAVNTAAAGDQRSGAAGATAITSRMLGVINSSTSDYYIDDWREDDAAFPGPSSPLTLPRRLAVTSAAVLRASNY